MQTSTMRAMIKESYDNRPRRGDDGDIQTLSVQSLEKIVRDAQYQIDCAELHGDDKHAEKFETIRRMAQKQLDVIFAN